MKKFLGVLIVIPLFVAISCKSGVNQEERLRARANALSLAVNSGEYERVWDMMLESMRSKDLSRDEYARIFREVLKGVTVTHTLQKAEVTEKNRLAKTRVEVMLTYKYPGAIPLKERICMVNFWQWEKGDWYILKETNCVREGTVQKELQEEMKRRVDL